MPPDFRKDQCMFVTKCHEKKNKIFDITLKKFFFHPIETAQQFLPAKEYVGGVFRLRLKELENVAIF